MKVMHFAQGSPEWFEARAGKVTASRIADLRAKTKSGWGASRKNYMAEVVCERLTGVKTDGYTNAAMQWGIDHEGEARANYEFLRDAQVVEIGMVIHPDIDQAAASPDGLVEDDGMVEIKCPNTATHISTLLQKSVDGKYIQQMQWQMACSGRSWCDFVSFDPRMPTGPMQLYVERIMRDDDLIREITSDVIDFLAEVDETIEKLTAMYGDQNGGN